ncbi:dicarboxylate/amino acid:cation symporter [Clostridium sp. Cult1]|uniref:dicarboxylate/amino acid:cation symporter n=1 Tax=Clostridium sp. Cult1 TaxID=2079002 RepID=UPI001F16CFEB|nr:dicarboxylate/amino acid:cation symporter [Clostridium sp. Cult1]MCF6461816.1 sodium:proton antiporter [Clostridium sp. Cult1]
MRKMGLLPKLIIAIILGIIIGNFGPAWIVRILATFNGLFGNFLGFAIPLIIIGFVAPGIGDLGEEAGKLLAITAGIAYGSTVFSGTLAYFTSSLVLPMFLTPGALNVNAANPEEALLQAYFQVEMPPIFGVMTALLIAFTLGLGIAAIKGDTIKNFMREFQFIIEKLISRIIIPLLPFHILGIFANMTYAGQVATILSVFARVFAMVILLHITVLIIQFIIGGAVTGGNPFRMLRNMVPAYFTAIGTQSSAATIPVTLEQTKKNGVKDDVADFVIPLCATIHLSGSTITLVSCSMAIMMLNGMATSFRVIFPFILMLGVTMVAAPGVPGGAVIAALGLLETMLGFPSAMLSLMIALYVAQDSFGTAANVTGDGAIALIVNRISGYRLGEK